MNMSEDDQVPDLISTIKSLKCHLCENILSVEPIFIISSEKSQCGRCKHVKHEGAIHNTLFESVARHLKFPCINTDCTTMLAWGDVETHERDCNHSTIICPMFHENCDDRISRQQLTEHMMRKHSNNISFEKIELTVASFKSYVGVAVVNSMEYLIYICHDKVLITSIRPHTDTLTYCLKLNSTVQTTPTLLYEHQTIETFDERKHCFRCLEKRCHLKQHPFSTIHVPKSINPPNDTSITNDEKKKSASNSQRRGLFSSYKASSGGESFHNGDSRSFNYESPGPKPDPKYNFSFSSQGSMFASPNQSTFGQNPNGSGMPQTVHVNTNNLTMSDTNVSNGPMNSASNSEDKTKQTFHIDLRQLTEIKFTSFNLTHLQNLIGVSPSIRFTIKISSPDGTEVDQSPSNDSFIPRNLLHTIDNTDILRKTLECPICNELMLGKIFLCERGHRICEKCKTSNAVRGTCPFCSGVLGNCRSTALEALAEECSLCCSYIDEGCEFRGSLKTVSRHEPICTMKGK